jgi:hypothetical protein
MVLLHNTHTLHTHIGAAVRVKGCVYSEEVPKNRFVKEDERLQLNIMKLNVVKGHFRYLIVLEYGYSILTFLFIIIIFFIKKFQLNKSHLIYV